MTTFPNPRRLLKASQVLIDLAPAAALRANTMQYNPDPSRRTLQVQGIGTQSNNRLEGQAAQAVNGGLPS